LNSVSTEVAGHVCPVNCLSKPSYLKQVLNLSSKLFCLMQAFRPDLTTSSASEVLSLQRCRNMTIRVVIYYVVTSLINFAKPLLSG